MDEGYLRRNPARLMERPTVVAMAPTELSEKQSFVLKQLVEQHAPIRFVAIFALGYWAGLRISEFRTRLVSGLGWILFKRRHFQIVKGIVVWGTIDGHFSEWSIPVFGDQDIDQIFSTRRLTQNIIT